MPYLYSPEFRRRVLDLLAAGRSVASLSAGLGVSDQTIYNWRRQDAVDRDVEPGLTSSWDSRMRSGSPAHAGIDRGLITQTLPEDPQLLLLRSVQYVPAPPYRPPRRSSRS